MDIVFAGGGTGGHLYPALSIARALVALDPAVRPFFVGAERGIERQLLPSAGFPFALFSLHPIYRTGMTRNLRGIPQTLGSWRALGRVLRARRPRVVVGTGGYASGIALAWSILHGLPTAQLVADAMPGVTARATSRWAKVLYLGFEAARPVILAGTSTAVLVTGNPVEPPPVPRPDRTAARAAFGIEADPAIQTVLVFGGSQGSDAINRAVAEWLSGPLPETLRVIWAVGTQHFEMWKKMEGHHVRVRPYLNPIAEAYAAADLAVTRAGAMTCAELTAWGLPAILIPLPTAAANHQTSNARALVAAGAGRLLEQTEGLGRKLGPIVAELLLRQDALGTMSGHSREFGRASAAQDIAKDMLTRFA